MKKIICRLFGHHWKHRSEMENLEDNNSIFLYGAARKCARCKKIQVSYAKLDEAGMYFI